MIQIYMNDERGINDWLKENHGKIEVIDIKLALNEQGELAMVVYKTKEEEF